MENFFYIIIVAAAVAYVLELIVAFLPISPSLVKLILTLPLSTGGLFLLNVSLPYLIVCAPAATFVALAMLKLVNKPEVHIPNRRNY